MTTYICKCGRRVKKSSSADNTGNRLKGYGPGHECYGCPYAMPWGGNEWNETAKRFVQDIKGYECRMSRTLSYGSLFIGSIKDKCTCSVFSLDFDFLEQISAWVKDTFSQGELTGGFSRDKIRPTDYSHNGRYCCTFVCAANKKGISAKAALLARFFNPDGSRKGMTPQQEMEKILADIKKAKEGFSCAPAQTAAAAATTEGPAVEAEETLTTSESAEDASALTPAVSPQACGSAPTPSAQCSDSATAAESQTAASPAAPEGSSPTTEKADAVSGSDAPGNATGKNAAPSAGSGSSSDKYLTFIPESMAPKFDYSGLSDQTVADLHLAEKEYQNGKKMAARGYIRMGEAVGIAHDVLVANCDKHNNQYSEDNFRKWCLSIGITKDTAYRLLKISSMFESSSPRQQDILQELPPSLLYAAAKPSAPPELVEQVKSGDITTYKEYQELMAQLKAEKERADSAEAHLGAANADINELAERVQKAEAERDKARADQLSTAKDCNRLGLKASQEKDRADKAEAREEEAWKLQSKAEARAKDAENQLSGSRKVAEAAKLRADKLQEENAALKKQPIAAVVDEEEVERRAKALAHQWDKEELDRLAAEKAWGLADARNSELAKDNTALRKQLATLQARANDNTQADFETANYCASLFRSAWDTCKGSYSRLTGEDLESTFQTLCGALNSIMEEASLLCRQPADYDGGAADEPDV